MKMVARSEIYCLALDPVVGNEMSKTRPCVVVSG
jgi:mRNA-degrading endonuclease toxin of MazEF toxin-antitoxin module